MRVRLFILLLSLIASLGTVVSGYINYVTMRKIIEKSIRLHALGITVPLKSALKNMSVEVFKDKPRFFYDILLDEAWEGVAYISLYDEKGTILLHSNPSLINKKVKDKLTNKANRLFLSKLKTDTPVYIYEEPVKISGRTFVLRIALFASPIEELFTPVRLNSYIAWTLAFIFFVVGIILYVVTGRYERVKEKVKELERIAFLSKILAHEIRNPLATIKGLSEYMVGKCKESEKKHFKTIITECNKVEKLLDDMVVYSYTTTSNPEYIDLIVLIEEILEKFRNNFHNVEITFKAKGEMIKVYSDKGKLALVMENLIKNAIDAVLEKQQGKGNVSVTVEKNKKTVITIEDNGCGIKPEILEKIWEPFFTTKTRGLGLGLAIVKKICDELGIDVSIKSKEGEGTKVWLTIRE